jgi:hypothetical protein
LLLRCQRKNLAIAEGEGSVEGCGCAEVGERKVVANDKMEDGGGVSGMKSRV